MPSNPYTTLFQTNATVMFCTFTLFLKMSITAFIQGAKAIKAGNRPPEDAFLIKEESNEEKRQEDNRWRRILQNDVENILIGLFIFWGAKQCAMRHESQIALMVLMPIWTLLRIGHTVSYAYAKQPLRAIMYFLALLVVFVAGLVGVIDSMMSLSNNPLF